MTLASSTDPFGPGFNADWERACRDDAELANLGACASVCFAVQAGAAVATVRFVDGRLEGIRTEEGAAEFMLRAPVDGWERFLQAVPPAPYHHVLAMKMRVPEFSVAGDERKLLQFAHLVRRSLELARWVANGRAAAALRAEGPVAAAAAGSIEPITGRYAWIEIEGRAHRIYYEQAGSGRDLLFLHTAGADTRQYHRLMNDAQLLRAWRMTAFDLPWHGKSLPPQEGVPGEWRLNTDRYVACIVAVIQALRLERPVLLGSSMGGQICLEMALRHGDALGGVIACEACDRITGRAVSFAKHALYNQALAVPEWIYGLMSPTTPRARATEIWWAYSQGGYGVFHGDIAFYAHDWDARERVQRIDTRRCPVIMLTGEYDFSCTPEASRATAAKIAGAEFRMMKGLGHFPMTENPETFLEYLRPALARLYARAENCE
ncbi:MAG: alpha/beta fold hydrolase [Betaproteobacteria bacterium]|nr:alpha/beta fold hydrolase [Betaproteobacteria bacterium]